MIRAKYKNEWEREHPGYGRTDSCYQLYRKEEANILVSAHSRTDTYIACMRISTTDKYSCDSGSPAHNEQRRHTWPSPVPIQTKLYGSTKWTAVFFKNILVDVWECLKKNFNYRGKKNRQFIFFQVRYSFCEYRISRDWCNNIKWLVWLNALY